MMLSSKANFASIGRLAAAVVASALVWGGGRSCLAGDEPELPKAAAAPVADVAPAEMHGIKLGEFRIRSDYPAEAQKCTIRFVLYAAVKEDRSGAMERLVEEHREKVRDEVITATRLTSLGVFEEPDLKTFRRHVFMRLHRTLPELVIDDLYVSDFGLIVKSL
ncbi:MAG TPA: hypothetical protein VHU84_08980 [Lacipirellulaceae bacterium]|jgi:hypothetical protein|nr:hypothetical protein [Lacipirellulaceae bacterium]